MKLKEYINKVLLDSNGNPSSKRCAGVALCIIGSAVLVYTALRAAWATAALPEIKTAYECGYSLIIIGGGLLGIGVVEWFGKKG